MPAEQTPGLTNFAQSVAEAFDPFRAPLSDTDRQARIERNGLTTRQIELLDALATDHSVRYLYRPANLEDLFLKLTGRQIRDDA